MIKLKLEQIINTDKDGKAIKDKDGNLTYIRHDTVALSQLLNVVDSKAVAVGEYPALMGLDDKFRQALKQDTNGVELSIDEGALLKRLLSNPQNDKVSFVSFIFVQFMRFLSN